MTDSRLVASQIKGEYQAREPLLQRYLTKVQEEMARFDQVIIEHVPREMNVWVDILSKLASRKRQGNNHSVIQANLHRSSIAEVVMPICQQLPTIWQWDAEKHGLEGLWVCYLQRINLSQRFLHSPSKTHSSLTGNLHAIISSWRKVWEADRGKSISKTGPPTWILLTDPWSRCRLICSKVWSVPVTLWITLCPPEVLNSFTTL